MKNLPFGFLFKCFLLNIMLINVNCSTFCSSDWRMWSPDRSAFLLSDFGMTFEEAVDFCRARSGYLANVTSEEEYFYLTNVLRNEQRGSVWVSNETRPEHFSLIWRLLYAPNEPDHSGDCVYLSASNDFKWRDTRCGRHKGALCERHDCDVIDADEVLAIFGLGVHPIHDSTTERTSTTAKSAAFPSKCTTLDGQICRFPFIYESETHSGCIVSNELDERLWCSVQTDQFDRHIEGTDTWGYCSNTCF